MIEKAVDREENQKETSQDGTTGAEFEHGLQEDSSICIGSNDAKDDEIIREREDIQSKLNKFGNRFNISLSSKVYQHYPLLPVNFGSLTKP